MKNKEEAESGGEKGAADADFIDCGSHLMTVMITIIIIITIIIMIFTIIIIITIMITIISIIIENADFIDGGSHLITVTIMKRVMIMMIKIMTKVIPTTTRTEQSLCLSSKELAPSSREMIQVFSGNEITVARPGENCYDLYILGAVCVCLSQSW